MSILIFVPLAVLAAVAERPQRRTGYRKSTAREFRAGRHIFE